MARRPLTKNVRDILIFAQKEARVTGRHAQTKLTFAKSRNKDKRRLKHRFRKKENNGVSAIPDRYTA